MNILDAMTDPALFAPSFQGDSWDRWKAFLAALFGLPMDEQALAMYQEHTGRTEPPSEPFKEAALVCGRRAGKSRVLATIAVFLATFRDYEPHLAPGEKATIAVLAASRFQARTIFRYCRGLLEETALLRPLVERETGDTIELTNRVNIEIATASYRVTRGYTFAAVLCDEIAFWRSEDTNANPDTEILQALRPGLSSIPGSILLLASSPYAKRGALYAAYRKHYGRDDARVLVWKADTATMNPKIDPEIIQEAYEDDPASASAEFGAQFRDDVSGFVTREALDACTVPGRYELPPITGTRYSAFVDPSGGSSDSMTLAISHREGEMAVLDAVRDVKPPFSPEIVTKDFADLMKSYRITRVTGDRYGGEWPREQFRKCGITYEVSDAAKSDIYKAVLPTLNSGRAELLDIPRLTSQFLGLERRTARGGRDSIDHGPGLHDDLANAAAGALRLVARNTIQPMVINPAAFRGI